MYVNTNVKNKERPKGQKLYFNIEMNPIISDKYKLNENNFEI